MKVLNIINNRFLKILDALTIVLTIGMVLSLFIQIIARYFFNTGFAWTEETARFMMVYLTYLGAGLISINGVHVNISILDDILKGVSRKALKVFQELVVLAFLIMILIFSKDSIRIASLSVATNIQINMAIVYAIVPIGCIPMIFGHVAKIIKFATTREDLVLVDIDLKKQEDQMLSGEASEDNEEGGSN